GLSRIATQMLKFHRDSNRPAEYSLGATLTEALDFHRAQAMKQGVTIQQDIEIEGKMVGYKGEMIQVITNLLVNALEATPSGGRIRVHLAPSPGWSHQVHTRCGYYISIADNGRGIDSEDQERIFEPFFTTKGDRGTGLGLWVCRGIVNRAGGSMRVRSTQREGRSGTCILIFLPAEAPASEKRGRRRYEVA
ncbi:MAG TPA: HAMP domain-containing sensor histidine kinase, partial [Terriglobales bacterium]